MKHTAPSFRTLRVGEQVRHALADILLRGDVHDARLVAGQISVTEARMSPDLRHATIFIRPMLGHDMDEILTALRQNTAFLQREVAHKIRMKYATKLKFLADTSYDAGGHIDALLRSPVVLRDLTAAEDTHEFDAF
jgi:ribosome-binding factor A